MFHLAAGMRRNHSGAKPQKRADPHAPAAGVHPDSRASYQVDSHEADR